MLKKKIALIATATVTVAALIGGATYAWFTNRAVETAASIEMGNLIHEISVTEDDSNPDLYYPGDFYNGTLGIVNTSETTPIVADFVYNADAFVHVDQEMVLDAHGYVDWSEAPVPFDESYGYDWLTFSIDPDTYTFADGIVDSPADLEYAADPAAFLASRIYESNGVYYIYMEVGESFGFDFSVELDGPTMDNRFQESTITFGTVNPSEEGLEIQSLATQPRTAAVADLFGDEVAGVFEGRGLID